MKDKRKPINNPMNPIQCSNKIDSKIPINPCPKDTNVGTLFNFKADKKITDTLSKIIKAVNTK